MRSRRPESSARTWLPWGRLRLRLVALLVRMWLRLAWPHLYLPEAVLRKRLAAARLVLILFLAIGVSFWLINWPGGGLRRAFRPCLCREWPLRGRVSNCATRRLSAARPLGEPRARHYA